MSHEITAGRRRIVLAAASGGTFLTPFMASSLNLALPGIGRTFGMSAVLLGWIPSAYLLTAAMSLIPFGKIADLAGRKKVFAWGSVVYAVASAAAIVAGSPAAFLAARVVQGIGGAMMMSTGVAMLTSVYPPEERGRVLGINVSFTYLGLSLGPVIGGSLTHHYGWRSIFAVNAAAGLALFGLVAWKLKGEEWTGGLREKFDGIGSILMGAALAALMGGMGRLPAVDGFGLVLGAVVFSVLFVFREKTARSPLLDLRLFRGNRPFVLSNLAALINYSATAAIGFLLSLYFQYIKGLSPQTAGLVLLAQPAMMVVFSPLAGRLSDRVEPRIPASAGMGIITAGLLFLATLGPDTQTAAVAGTLVVLGFGFALFSSPNMNAVMGAAGRRAYGVASAVLGTMRLTGQMFSLGLASLVFALRIGRVPVTPEVHPAFLAASRIVFLLCAALGLAGVFASLSRGTIHDDRRSGDVKADS